MKLWSSAALEHRPRAEAGGGHGAFDWIWQGDVDDTLQGRWGKDDRLFTQADPVSNPSPTTFYLPVHELYSL